MLSFYQEFPFYVFRSFTTAVHPPVAVLRWQVAGDHAECAGRDAKLLAPPYAYPTQHDGSARLADWEAEAGRGKRSRLSFLYTGLALQQQRAEDLLDQDRIDQLVQLVGDKAAVRQMLVSHLGRSFRQGRHILRVLYYRPMKNLLPGSALRRSETHIARQILAP